MGRLDAIISHKDQRIKTWMLGWEVMIDLINVLTSSVVGVQQDLLTEMVVAKREVTVILWVVTASAAKRYHIRSL